MRFTVWQRNQLEYIFSTILGIACCKAFKLGKRLLNSGAEKIQDSKAQKMRGQWYKMGWEGEICLYAGRHGQERIHNDAGKRKDMSMKMNHGDFLASASDSYLLVWKLLLLLHEL